MKRILALATVVLSLVASSASAALVVPGTANPWLAGMPDGTISNPGLNGTVPPNDGNDTAPANSPVLVPGLQLIPGTWLNFNLTGGVARGPIWPLYGPDGGEERYTWFTPEHGMSGLHATIASLVGVFLSDDQPDLTPAPTELVFFGPGTNVPGGFNYAEISPELKQPFFIGDNFTDLNERQRVIVPNGATRLYLGVMDTFEWSNNLGQFQVDVFVDPASVPEPSSFVLAGLGGMAGLVCWLRKRRNTQQSQPA